MLYTVCLSQVIYWFNKHILLAELLVHTVYYGPSFFSSNLLIQSNAIKRGSVIHSMDRENKVNKMFIIMAFCLGELETSAGQVIWQTGLTIRNILLAFDNNRTSQRLSVERENHNANAPC